MTHTKYFKVGHPLFPEGRVIVQTLDNTGAATNAESYTLEQWAALQQ